MADKFDIQGIIKKVRVSMNPELGVPLMKRKTLLITELFI